MEGKKLACNSRMKLIAARKAEASRPEKNCVPHFSQEKRREVGLCALIDAGGFLT
jgi:hypothetical protein